MSNFIQSLTQTGPFKILLSVTDIFHKIKDIKVK